MLQALWSDTYTHTYTHAHMHACMHTCMHLHTFAYNYLLLRTFKYIYIHLHPSIHTCIHASMHPYTDRQTYRQTYRHRDTHTQTHWHTYVCTYARTYVPTYIPTYLHTYIPTYLHTYIDIEVGIDIDLIININIFHTYTIDSTIERLALLLSGHCQALSLWQEGLYDDDMGSCTTCPEGSYCTGDGQKVLCPNNSTTTNQRRARSDCSCKPGYFAVRTFYADGSQETDCQPCPRKSYKPNLGDGECPLKCPANANSELGAVTLADCFCEPNFYASIDSNSGQLDKCILCTFEGLDCRGGFENQTNHTATSGPGVHALPIAQFLSCTQNDACLPIFSHCVITRD